MSDNFNMGALLDWQEIASGEVLRFALPNSGIRQADFQVMADGVVSVCAVGTDNQTWLVGYGSGLLNIKFGMSEEIMLTVFGPEGCSIYIKTKVGTQVMSESGEPTFTDIEPRRMTQSEKVTRVQEMMAANAQRRVAALMEGLEAQARALEERAAAMAAASVVVEPLEGGGGA